MHQVVPESVTYLTVKEACVLAQIGRTTFYRLLDDRAAGLAEVVVRVPVIKRIRIPRDRFCRWLKGRSRPQQ